MNKKKLLTTLLLPILLNTATLASADDQLKQCENVLVKCASTVKAQQEQLDAQRAILEESLARNAELEKSKSNAPLWHAIFFVVGVSLGAFAIGNASK